MVACVPARAVVLVNENPSILATDKKILRDAGMRPIVTMTSACAAAKRLADNPTSSESLLLVIGGRASDMSGEQLCAILRLHPRLVTLPILLIVDSESAKAEIETLGTGASALLARPFSTETLRSVLTRLLRPQTRKPDLSQTDEKRFYACLENRETLLKPNHHPPEAFYKVGLQCLQQKKVNSAIMAFTQALASKTLKGEAELGLAAAYSSKGDTREASTWLSQATETMILAKRWKNARAIFARAQNFNEAVRNPFFILARKQIYRGDYSAAAETLAEGASTIPPVQVSEKIAGLCVLARNPKAMLAKAQHALVHKAASSSPIATILGDILPDLAERVQQKLIEARGRALRAQAQRTEELSKRISLPKETDEATAKEALADAETPNERAQAAVAQIASDIGLLPLPGEEDADAKANTEAEHTEGEHTDAEHVSETSTHTGFLGDILQTIKLTWRLMRS